MLPKQHRLALRKKLFRVKKEGKLFSGKLFSILVAKAEKTAPSQFGFIISSKVHKRAVKRNQARRLIIRAITPLLPKLKPGFEVVFLAKKALIGQEFSQVEKEVNHLFQKASLL